MAEQSEKLTITEEWCIRARRAIEQRKERTGESQYDIAVDIGIPPPTLSEIVRGQQRSSIYVRRISEALEVRPPYEAIDDDDIALAAEKLKELKRWDPATYHERYAEIIRSAEAAERKNRKKGES